MRKVLAWACILAWAVLGLSLGGAQAAKKKTARKTTASSKSSKKTPAKKSPASSKSGKKATSSKSGKKAASSKRGKKGAVRTTWRNRQLAPTPERYKQIQDALAAKGYLPPEEANGAWGQGSVDALKRFQADQRIDATGKINSLSLIALGLGPRRDPAPASKPPETPSGQIDR